MRLLSLIALLDCTQVVTVFGENIFDGSWVRDSEGL